MRKARRHAAATGIAPLLAVVLAAAGSGALAAAPASAAPALRAGFAQTDVFTGLTDPTAVRFAPAPDTRVFVAEKRGVIKAFDSLADATPAQVIDLRTEVHNFWDRGLLGLEVDPGFPQRPYLYALYTRDADTIGGPVPRWGTAGTDADGCPVAGGATGDIGCVVTGRLVRIRVDPASAVADAPPVTLLDDWCQQYPSHSVGDLRFGPDGALYASAGDGASFNYLDYGQKGNPCGDPPTSVGTAPAPPGAEGGALRSQDVRTPADPTGLDGAIVRIDPDTGAPWPGNPLSGPDENARRIVAHGLRNPFRFTRRPGSGELWIGDVGWGSWEEVDRLADPGPPLENFGWPCYEGAGRQGSYDAADLALCESLYALGPAAHSAPHWAYPRTAVDGCTGRSVTGLAFHTSGDYPAPYDDGLFVGDYSGNCVWFLPTGADGRPDPARATWFVTGQTGIAALEAGPGGDLVGVDLTGDRVWRIEYGGNTPPAAVVEADRTSGPAPLTVQFDATGSSDPDGDVPLAYAWDLDGDGEFDDSTGPRPTSTYPSPGNVTVRLQVTDARGARSVSAPVTIAADDAPPTARITAPAATHRWSAEEPIAFSGEGTDGVDGGLAAERLRWELDLHHCDPADPSACHVHPLQRFTGASWSFTAPDHEYPAFLRLRLTATDSAGLTGTHTIDLQPSTVSVTVDSVPAGMNLSIGGRSGAAPLTATLIRNGSTTASAPTPQESGGRRYVLSGWSDGGAPTHDVLAAADTALTATFSGPPPVADALPVPPSALPGAPAEGPSPLAVPVGPPGVRPATRTTRRTPRRVVRVSRSRRALGLRLRCRASRPCRGTLTLLGVGSDGRRGVVTGSRRGVAVPAGRSRVVRVALRRWALRRLRSMGRVRMTAVLRRSDGRTTLSVPLLVLAPRRR